ncbi:MAG: rhomboid family intramembrane serine protease [Prochlorococcaceae cyanobacterium]|jgi:membrane associated rhomboid family serine protease
MQRLRAWLLMPPLILAIAWGQELIDQLIFAGRWNLPLLPRGPLLGLLTAPFSHGDLAHLLSNSIWFLPLSWLVLLRGRGDYGLVWLLVILGQLPLWLFGRHGVHGLSGVVYGLLGFLLAIGWCERRPLAIGLSLLALIAYGGLLPSLLPFVSPPGISWSGHLAGFLAGVAAASLAATRQQPARPH